MPTPVAHLLTGYAIHQTSRRLEGGEAAGFLRPGWLMACSTAPDLDILLSWWFAGDRHLWHRHWTHSLSAVLLAALAGALVLGRGWSPLKGAMASAAAVGSHLVLDLVTGARLGWEAAYGAALWVPFDPAKLSLPISLIPGLQGVFTLRNLGVVLIELLVFGALTLWISRRVTPTAGESA